jgi:hypothetical protein
MVVEKKAKEETLSIAALEERVKIAELHAREAEAKVRLNNAKAQLTGRREERKARKAKAE